MQLSCIWVVLASVLVTASSLCPNRCICERRTVRCMHLDMDSVPKLPADTQTLDLRFNKIRDIPPGAFSNLRRLNILLLNNNYLTMLREGIFAGMPRLKYLYLFKNRIHHIDRNVFQGLPDLQQLYLHHNDIQNLQPDLLSNLPRLERLFLHENKLQHLPEGLFVSLRSLRRLRLDSNALLCDCGVVWLARMLREQRTLQAAVTCHSPENLAGVSVATLREEHFHCQEPVFMEEPDDVTVSSGRDAIFSCQVRGDPEPEIIWMRDSNEISLNDDRYNILDNGSLKITKPDESDAGIFECMARSSMGEVKSRPARMIVSNHLEDLVFSMSPHSMNVKLNQKSVTLNCLAKGKPKPHIRWFHNDRQIALTDRITIHRNGSITIINLRANDAGIYICKAKNIHHEISAAAEIKINSIPKIVVEPTSRAVLVGETLELVCKATGTPEPIITWYRNEKALSPSTRAIFREDFSHLIITSLEYDDDGIYLCRAENSEGFIERSADIEVVDELGTAPKLTLKPFDIDAAIGTIIEIPCRSDGDPEPDIDWKKEGSSIEPNHRVKISPLGSLFIHNVTQSDAGRYECVASNDFGSVNGAGLLKIKDTILPGDKFVKIAFADAKKDVDAAINHTLSQLLNQQNSVIDTGDLFRIIRYPNAPAREVARAAEIYERTLVNIRKYINAGITIQASPNFDYKEILSTEHLNLIGQLSGCMAHREISDCSNVCFHSKYRNIDGSCNNLENPLWGSSLTAFRRILPAIYENGFSQPVGWNKNITYNGYPLPSTRLVSTKVISTKVITPDKYITHMVMQWGQFLDHDLDHAIPSVSSQSWDGIDCKKSCEYAAPCFPMDVPPGDVRIPNRRCIDFVRSSAICGSGMTSVFFGEVQPREQINQLTSFIDTSQVYGFSEEFAKDLRDFSSDNGLLRKGPTFPGRKPLLPYAGNQGVDCRRNPLESNVNCFLAGDIRANEQVGLLAMHTIWFREHNRIATALKEINPFWDGDTLYHEARKIVGAMAQHITYNDWLKIILGEEGMKTLGNYKSYDPSINPSISNAFATAALRFGHSLINPVLHRLDRNFTTIKEGHLPLHKAFFSPWRVVDEGGVDPLMRGLFVTPAKLKTPGQNLNTELTEKLFHATHAVALDLAAINIQRSRDHAIPFYTEWRKFCNISDVNTFEDLKGEISDYDVRRKLENLYGSVDNVDIWVGGILEDQMEGAKVGPLFSCILIEQFRRLRDGDRLWYERTETFKPEQQKQIKKASLARVLCDNGDDIDRISKNVFILSEHQGGTVNCTEIPTVDLRYWADCSDCSDSVFESPKRSRRSAPIDVQPNLDELQDQWKTMSNTLISFEQKIKEMEAHIKRLENNCGMQPQK